MNHKEILNQVRAENNTEKIEWCYLPADEIYEAMKRAAKQAWINGYNQGIIEESWDTGFSFDDYMLRIAEPTQIAQKNEFVIPDVGSQLPDCEHKKRVIRYGIEQCEDCGKPF